jgi:hypothetical protein
VGPPEEHIDILRRLSQKLLNPSLIIDNDKKVVTSSIPLDSPLKNTKIKMGDDVPDFLKSREVNLKGLRKSLTREIFNLSRDLFCETMTKIITKKGEVT